MVGREFIIVLFFSNFSLMISKKGLYTITEKFNSGRPKHFKCNICNKDYLRDADNYFTDDQRIDKHMATHLNEIDERYVCKICSYVGMTLKDIKQHKKEHTNTNDLK